MSAAAAVALSIVAIGIALAALMDAVRDNGSGPGRVVDTQLAVAAANEATLYAIDEFYAVRAGDGNVHALYVYPPGFYGHVRGCRVVWDGQAPSAAQAPAAVAGPGLFVDPCSGARYGRDGGRVGGLVAGTDERGLDHFAVSPGVGGVVVDTRTLYCGAAPATDVPAATPTPEPCDRVSPGD